MGHGNKQNRGRGGYRGNGRGIPRSRPETPPVAPSLQMYENRNGPPFNKRGRGRGRGLALQDYSNVILDYSQFQRLNLGLDEAPSLEKYRSLPAVTPRQQSTSTLTTSSSFNSVGTFGNRRGEFGGSSFRCGKSNSPYLKPIAFVKAGFLPGTVEEKPTTSIPPVTAKPSPPAASVPLPSSSKPVITSGFTRKNNEEESEDEVIYIPQSQAQEQKNDETSCESSPMPKEESIAKIETLREFEGVRRITEQVKSISISNREVSSSIPNTPKQEPVKASVLKDVQASARERVLDSANYEESVLAREIREEAEALEKEELGNGASEMGPIPLFCVDEELFGPGQSAQEQKPEQEKELWRNPESCSRPEEGPLFTNPPPMEYAYDVEDVNNYRAAQTQSEEEGPELDELYYMDKEPSMVVDIPTLQEPMIFESKSAKVSVKGVTCIEDVVTIAPLAPTTLKSTFITSKPSTSEAEEEEGKVKSASSKKLTNAQKKKLKKAGRKARKSGLPHARSIQLPDLPIKLVGREDSDLDWGSDGPNVISVIPKGAYKKENRKQRLKRERAEQREREKVTRLASDLTRELEEMSPRRQKKGKQKTDYVDEGLDDYMDNIMNGSHAEILPGFLAGLNENQSNMFDLGEGARILPDSSDEMSSSFGDISDSGDETFSEGDEVEMDFRLGQFDAEVERIEMELEEQEISEEDLIYEDLDGNIQVVAFNRHRSKPEASLDDIDETDEYEYEYEYDEDEEDAEFEIAGRLRYKNIVRATQGSGKRAVRNALLQDVVFNGLNVDEADELDEVFDEFELLRAGKSKKGKNKLKALERFESEAGEAAFFEENLQMLWENDRKKKAEKKKQRALERALREQVLADKKRRPINSSNGSPFETYHSQMRKFALELPPYSEDSLALPPMSKKSRIVIHVLAEAYFLKSASRGSGEKRFTTLTRTAKTGIKVNDRKLEAILEKTRRDRETGRVDYENDDDGFFPRGGFKGGKQGGLWAALNASWKSGSSTPRHGGGTARHSEGAIVAVGADRIGETNVGFQMLQKMGWKEGGTIGLEERGGISEPIVARIKNSKSGLGSGYSLNLAQAKEFALPSQAVLDGW